MPPRIEVILRVVCVALGLLLATQVGRMLLRADPLSRVRIPELPTLPAANAINAAPGVASAAKAATNRAPEAPAGTSSTNTQLASNATPAGAAASAGIQTNAFPATNRTEPAVPAKNTNIVAAVASPTTNPPAAALPAIPMAMPGPGGPGMPMADLPKETRAKLDRIVDSEILGAVMRPMPSALMGIIGQDALLRGPTGQTGLVREGASLGPLKLIKIGINRVLVEEDGKTKELTIFGGIGGQSLMPAATTNTP